MACGRMCSLAALALAGASFATPVLAAHQGWQTAADVGEIGLVALALGKSAADRDWQGEKQLGLSLAVTAGATAGLKSAFPEERPNHTDDKSFPSGHTSLSFAAAGYLQKRYGWQWGLPATLAAGVVGLSRVESKDHHWYDVVAGAALGEAVAYVFTRPRDSNVQFLPWADLHGAGVVVATRF
ncbi:MAG: phosphatase family protein [Phenylobacterium sp.]|nr:phosphatase family protein [Phenylobacterium sp.]